MVKKTED